MDKNTVKPLDELLDSVRDIDGFPKGKDEDILSLSDPPFFTACPNPYLNQFIKDVGIKYNEFDDKYYKEPYVGDISEGKHDPIYTAHTYHTKVPHKAVTKFINHYTKPNDIVFDGFCGTGMVGIAAALSNRYAVVSELSPIATFISYNLLKSFNPSIFEKEFNEIINNVKDECKWMYVTKHTKKAINTRTKKHPTFLDKKNDIYGNINYVVWNDMYECQYCGNEICFGESQDEDKPGEFRDQFVCPFCGAEIEEANSKKVTIKKYDKYINKEIQTIKQKPILISYSIDKTNFWKKPDEYDTYLVNKIENLEIPYWFPIKKIPEGFNTRQPKKSHNIEYVHHFFTKRNLWILSKFYEECKLKDFRYWFIISSLLQKSSKLMALNADYIGRVTKGVLYISSINQEINIFYYIKKNLSSFKKALEKLDAIQSRSIISTQSATDLSNIPDNSIDYIFTDPPFGGNIMYSELNIIWESFLRVSTNIEKEAIENPYQHKNLEDYTKLMTDSFKEMHRILKPNRWITIEFHNSKASVWNSIQEALVRSGFIIAQVSVLDKKIGSFKQITSPGSVKNDLIISAYKPKKGFSNNFLKNFGSGMEIKFIDNLLQHLPVRPNIERTEKMLYSKMLAYYIQNGFKIKYNSTNFYNLLSDNFVELDGYWFLEEQVKEYNKWKSGLSLDELKKSMSSQQTLFVSDEKTALTWLYHFLNEPRSYSDIFTAYQQVATTSDDAIPEIKELLENNFILENGRYRRPLSKEEKEELNRNRDKELDRAFNRLLTRAKEQKGKIKDVRKEALIHGFTKCYQKGQYQNILTIADKLYTGTLESSGEIMDFVDIARIKTKGKKNIEDF